MHAGLRREQPVCVLAGHGECRAFYAGFLAWLFVDQFSLKAVALRPTQIHPQQHSRPILGVGSASARVYGYYRIAGVVGPGQQHLRLGFFDLAFEPLDDSLQFLKGSLIFGREFQEDGGIFDVTLELIGFVDRCLQPAALLEKPLGAVLIVPEIRFAYLCFRFLKLGRFSLRVKETSAAPPREPPGLRTSF